MEGKEFVTANQKLEQFLWMHRIRFKAQRKNMDMLNEWIYDRTPQLEVVVEEFRRIYTDRAS